MSSVYLGKLEQGAFQAWREGGSDFISSKTLVVARTPYRLGD